jgi:hypothetical protein
VILRYRFAARPDRQDATLGHRVPGVQAEIQDRHFDLLGIDSRRRQVRAQVEGDFDLGPDAGADQVAHVEDQACDVDRARLQRLSARKSQQALDQQLGPFGRLQRHIDQPKLSRVVRAAPVEQIEAADDRRQEIVEIVGDPSHELAHRLQLLRLPQFFTQLCTLPFRLFLDGEILEAIDGADLGAAFVEDRGDVDQDRHPRPVRSLDDDFLIASVFAGPQDVFHRRLAVGQGPAVRME